MKLNGIRGWLPLICLATALPSLAQQQQVVVPETSREINTDEASRARTHTELSSLYYQGGAISVALEEANKAIKIDPTYALAYSMRGLINAALRDYIAAEADFKKALSLAPEDPEIGNNYGWFLCERMNKPQEGLPFFLSAVKNPLYTRPDIAYVNAGTCAMKTGDLAAAREYLTNAILMARDSWPMAQLQLAKLAYSEDNLQEARNRLQEIMQHVTTLSPEALWLGVRIERKMSNTAEENSLKAQLKRLYPNSAEYQELLKGNYE